MLECRHGGFAAAVVSCEDSSIPSVGRHSPTDARGDVPIIGRSILAVAGGLDGPLRTGGRVLNSAEWLCADRGCWYPLSNMNFGRYGCASASLPNQFVVIGGSTGRTNLASVEALDLRASRWRDLAPLPKALYGCAASTVRVSAMHHVVVACGGCDESRSAVKDTYIYDIAADRWRMPDAKQEDSTAEPEAASRSLKTPRMCHAAIAVPRRCLPPQLWTNMSEHAGACLPVEKQLSDMTTAAAEECMLALGGKPPDDTAPIHGSVEVFDPRRCAWASMPWQLPEPMWHHSASITFV